MASDIVYDAVRAHIEASWTDTAAVGFENEAFRRRDGSTWSTLTLDPPEGEPWVLVEMVGTFYGQGSLGADSPGENRWDEEGFVLLHIGVPAGTGAREAKRLARQAADLFRGVLLAEGSLEFLDATIGRGDRDGAWFGIGVEIDFRRMEP